MDVASKYGAMLAFDRATQAVGEYQACSGDKVAVGTLDYLVVVGRQACTLSTTLIRELGGNDYAEVARVFLTRRKQNSTETLRPAALGRSSGPMAV